MANLRKQSVEARANKLRASLGMQGIPVPVDKIAKSLGARVRFSPLDDELSGFIYIKDGVPIIGVAAYHVYKGWRERFLGDLREHPGRWVVIAAKFGYIAKGIALAAVGVLFITAAIQHQPGKATGLDGALRSMRDLPAGTVILLGIALGLAAYGVYSFARARYARV